MLIQGMFEKNQLMGAAMQAAVVRNDVINDNIANAETPGYKKKAVQFETMLQNALDNYRKTGTVDLRDVVPTIQREHTGFEYRLDENNVDIELEMVDLYQNNVKYDMIVSGIINNYKILNYAITAIK